MSTAELHLTPDELAEVTGYKQRCRWAKQLALMGIRFTLRAKDGFPLVLREAYTGKRRRAPIEPDWEAVRGPTKAA